MFYTVKQEITVKADSALEAAKKARETQQRFSTMATEYTVTDADGITFNIDLKGQ